MKVKQTKDLIFKNVKTYHDAVDSLNQTATRIFEREMAKQEEEQTSFVRTTKFSGIGRQVMKSPVNYGRANPKPVFRKRNTEELNNQTLVFPTQKTTSIK